MKLVADAPRPRVTKRIIRRTIRTIDGGKPQITESVEEVPLDPEDDVERVLRDGKPIVSRKIIRRVVKKSHGVDREVTKTVTWVQPDGTERTEVIDLSRQSMALDERPKVSAGGWLRRSLDGGSRDQTHTHF